MLSSCLNCLWTTGTKTLVATRKRYLQMYAGVRLLARIGWLTGVL